MEPSRAGLAATGSGIEYLCHLSLLRQHSSHMVVAYAVHEEVLSNMTHENVEHMCLHCVDVGGNKRYLRAINHLEQQTMSTHVAAR
jgi:hypothetical protein